MESARTSAKSVCYLAPGTAILNPSYDGPISGPVSRGLAKVSKFIVSSRLGLPSMFTPGTDIELINIDDPRLEKSAAKNFNSFYSKVTKSNKDCFHVQTPGDLGQTAWKKAAKIMIQDIQRRLEAGENPLKVYGIGHSHGGQNLRYVAEAFVDNPNVEFYFSTIETPLSIYPPILMPKNVKVWLQFVCPGSFFREFGSCIMQSEYFMQDQTLASPIGLLAIVGAVYQYVNGMYTGSIEEVHRDRQANWVADGSPLSEFWKTFVLDTSKFKDTHNGPVMDVQTSKFISEKFFEFCQRYAENVEIRPRPGLAT